MLKRWIIMEIGCLECGIGSDIFGVYKTEEEAELALPKNPDRTDIAYSLFEMEVPE